jgi:hypothetical protein
MELGRLGVWVGMDGMCAEAAAAFRPAGRGTRISCVSWLDNSSQTRRRHGPIDDLPLAATSTGGPT